MTLSYRGLSRGLRATDHDLRPRAMHTFYGKKMGFELRCMSVAKGNTGKVRNLWVVVFPDSTGRVANDQEVQLWTALPNKMTALDKETSE